MLRSSILLLSSSASIFAPVPVDAFVFLNNMGQKLMELKQPTVVTKTTSIGSTVTTVEFHPTATTKVVVTTTSPEGSPEVPIPANLAAPSTDGGTQTPLPSASSAGPTKLPTKPPTKPATVGPTTTPTAAPTLPEDALGSFQFRYPYTGNLPPNFNLGYCVGHTGPG